VLELRNKEVIVKMIIDRMGFDDRKAPTCQLAEGFENASMSAVNRISDYQLYIE